MSALEDDAAEYVLGTLDRAEREAFAGRLASDVAARRAVAAWEVRLAGLSAGLMPVAPPLGVWAGIERALEQGTRAPSRPRALFEGVAATGRSLRSLWVWQVATAASTGLAAALLVLLAFRGLGPSEGDASYIAAVNRGGDKPALLVRVDLRTHKVSVHPVTAQTPSGKSLQLWFIGAGQSPRSVGIVDRAPSLLPVPASFPTGGQARGDVTFAVSVEPPGGSRTGGPTGPVIYSGELVRE